MYSLMKFIVIGAGILGASTAYQLAKAGARVVIVDRKDQGQATDAAAGIVCPWLSQRRNKAWYQLAKGGASFYPKLIEELKEDGELNTGYAKVGAISVHNDQEKLLQIEKRALLRREDAPEIGDVTILTPQETKKLFPLLADGFGSVHVSGAARVDGRALRDALLRGAQSFGASIIRGNAELLYSDTSVEGVTINGDKIVADTTIVTTGAWGSQILSPLGVQFMGDFQKAQIIHLKVQGLETRNLPVVMPPTDQYILAFEDERIVIGATHENHTGFDTRITAGGLQEVFSKALEIAPGLSNAAFIEARVGFRPFTPGFLPIIGPLPGYQGILVANGLGASGLTMGPFIGLELSRLALGKSTTIDLGLYDVKNAIH
ncbi:NAD(P)/FAD-dependent oxidoreductase [Heyndrickxia acidicola]|uniref:FAD-binding oxidoreductase n=1 Tax=Heyndrickxia acidicola TaxID=209389 RepID=A0ABU6MMC9_9BACI|nr:FAD-binding oxidoreductase [Heyndrickxia acidicola]MED1205518.1 FAD-binding oxidoreductase [Heyndrickxia acidicola]